MRPAVNIAAYVALTCGLLALLILPIVLSPIAIVSGVIGESQSRREGRGGQKAALAGLLLGLIGVLLVLSRMGQL